MNLLIIEEPLNVSPTLAKKIGLKEACFIQKLRELIDKDPYTVRALGYTWVRKSNAEWCKELPFLSETTIKRIKKKLKDKGILKVEYFGKEALDHTSFQTIDYIALDSVLNSEV